MEGTSVHLLPIKAIVPSMHSLLYSDHSSSNLEDLRSSKGRVVCPEEGLVCDFTCAVIQRY
jgi:hypothetical protein